jgi:Arc/MetJ family transcription regulator
MIARFTYRRLVELVDGDEELIAWLIDESVADGATEGVDDHVIEPRGDDRVTVDIDSVLAARTLRELDVDWSGIPIILRLRRELAEARRRIAELEAAAGPPDHRR